ncbi:hypothetical protein C1646_773619 [Rhizophagus diaphanus]|nr:hypothetical protein C1646_773619 [Rhizophagus diaphanus] [Rhizophagus sp. MUCL 43196]
MADIYDTLEEIKNKHEIEKHIESREEYQTDPSCLRCYRINEGEEPEMFKKFWKVFSKNDKVEENLLGNRELLMYGYIIEDDELDMRFAKFEEWL